MKLIIAEKPSVAKGIAAVVGANVNKREWLEGNGYCVTWCFGHLLELYVKEAHADDVEGKPVWKKERLPLIPSQFELRPISRAGIGDRVNIIGSLFRRCDSIVVATDAGREGELIFRNLYKYLGCRKPFERLWISSLTEKAIAEGMRNLKPGHDYDNLAVAAEMRSYADWLVGINATRAFTILVGKRQVLSLGRVQTVVLCMICRRYVENKTFKSEPFWFLQGEAVKDGLPFKWRGTSRYDAADKGQAAKDAVLKLKTLTVDEVVTERVKDAPPLLHDLASLQKIANQRCDMTAERTLAIAQSLYEKKLITYPRTGSRYIPEDVFATLPSLLETIPDTDEYRTVLTFLKKGKLNKRSVDDSKLTDHHALIITENNPEDLTEDEAKVYDLVLSRFLEAFLPDNIADVTKVKFRSGDIELSARGRRDVALGWRILKKGDDTNDMCLSEVDEIELNVRPLPSMSKGDVIPVANVELVEDVTKPKPLLTDATLLSEMENAGNHSDNKNVAQALKGIGIGTPATRAAELEKVIARRYVIRKGKNLCPTDFGILVYGAVKDKYIASVDMTAMWETELKDIEEGTKRSDVFYNDIVAFTRNVVREIFAIRNFEKIRVALEKYELKCPRCGKAVKLGDKSAWCPECGYTLYRLIAGKRLNDATMRRLLKEGNSGLVSGFKGKTGKEFSAVVVVDKDGNTTFDFTKKA